MKDLVEKYKAMGYTRFQLKLGGNYRDDIDRIRACHSVLDSQDVLIGDANTGVENSKVSKKPSLLFFCLLGWLTHHALQIAKSVRDLDSFYLEQPCVSYEECLTVRKHTDLPYVMDENVNDLKSLVKAWQDHAADVVNIKISKFGGITKAKEAIEFCINMGIAMTIEDTWGGMY